MGSPSWAEVMPEVLSIQNLMTGKETIGLVVIERFSPVPAGTHNVRAF